MESCTAALGILTQLPNLQHCLTWLQVPPVASSTNRIFTGNNFANIMNLVNSFHALRSRSIAVRFGSQHNLSSAVVGFCVEQICIPLTSTHLVAKLIWARARRLSDNNNLT